jgi:hypothetical protein
VNTVNTVNTKVISLPTAGEADGLRALRVLRAFSMLKRLLAAEMRITIMTASTNDAYADE